MSGRALGSLALASGLCLATAMLVWLGFQATLESRRAARLLLERRAAEQLALLWAGVAQDMKGAHTTVLVPITPGQLVFDPLYDLADLFAVGFARFPYPESFFAWKSDGAKGGIAYVFNRAERPPVWHAVDTQVGPYPVSIVRDAPALSAVVEQARDQARPNRPFLVFETHIGALPYQVVVNLMYGGEDPHRLYGLVGFTVNLEWVRSVYFEELAHQIARVGGEPEEIALAILDERGQIVTTTRPPSHDSTLVERSFPLVFVDRALRGGLPPHESRSQAWTTWTARAAAAQNSRLVAAAAGNHSAFVLISVAAAFAIAGLLITARGVQAAADLAAMKSDFVSSVTHELKTPLAGIRLVADTLASGRYDSLATVRDYAQLLSRESKTLTRLIDNLLAFARVSDAARAYALEPLEVDDLIDDALDHVHALLVEQGFTVDVQVAQDLPPVQGDRSALIQVLESILDNAMKYSDGTRALQIQAHAAGPNVIIGVRDWGIGIHHDEVGRVCDKFFRGRNARVGGSGLGLTIARQIVKAHAGRIEIDTAIGKGTRVDIMLPRWGHHEQPSADR
jgi:signal transduction histidine kinase